MEPPEALNALKALLPDRTMFSALSDWIPRSILYYWGEKKLGLYVAAVVASVGAMKLVAHISSQNRRKKWNAAGKDVVVFHNAQRGKFTPSGSPFALKLETYLKMADIPYVVDFTEPIGPKGKLPWITLNGESIADSQLIIEKLGQKFDKDFSSHLTPDQKGVAQAMRIMTEEHFFWCLEIWFVIVDGGRTIMNSINLSSGAVLFYKIIMPFAKRKIRHTSQMQGIGRHTDKEVEEMGKKDITALSAWLGSKPFFMGDKPTEVDCSLFGFLAQLEWNFPDSPYGKMLKTDCANLSDYCHRMKEKIWPDWNDCLDPPQPNLIIRREVESEDAPSS